MKFKNAYSASSGIPSYENGGMPSLTKSEFKDECDINNIIDMYRRTGTPVVNPQFNNEVVESLSDFDLKSSLDSIYDLQDEFESLPAKTRAVYDNDLETWFNAMLQHDDSSLVEKSDEGQIKESAVGSPQSKSDKDSVDSGDSQNS